VPAEVNLRRQRHSISAAMEALAASGRQQEMRLSHSTRDAKSSTRTRQHTRRPERDRKGVGGCGHNRAEQRLPARREARRLARDRTDAGGCGHNRAEPRSPRAGAPCRGPPAARRTTTGRSGGGRLAAVTGKRERHGLIPRGAGTRQPLEELRLLCLEKRARLSVDLACLFCWAKRAERERRHEHELACRAPLIFRGRNEQDKLVEHELIDA
jgi:hypothetical protein